MKIEYHKQADAHYILLIEAQEDDNIDMEEGVTVDLRVIVYPEVFYKKHLLAALFHRDPRKAMGRFSKKSRSREFKTDERLLS